MPEDELEMVIESLLMLSEDQATPKNVKLKLKELVDSLSSKNGELSLKINQALSELGDVASDTNLQSFSRTKVWEVISLLEKV